MPHVDGQWQTQTVCSFAFAITSLTREENRRGDDVYSIPASKISKVNLTGDECINNGPRLCTPSRNAPTFCR